MIKSVAISGGSEIQLWPLSRLGHLKEFLALNGKTLFKSIEIQIGTYLDEDDIVRFKDIYRCN